MDDVFKGGIAIIGSTVFWAVGGGVLARLLSSQGFPLVWSTPFSFLVAGVALYAYSKHAGLTQEGLLKNKAFYGLVVSNALAVLFAFLSFEHASLGASTFMQLFSIPLAPVAAWIFLKEELPGKVLAAMAVAVAGVLALNNFASSFSSIGLLYAFLSALASVSTFLFARKLKARFNTLLASYVFLACFLVLLPVAAVSTPVPAISFVVVSLVLAMGFIDLALGDMLRLYSLSKAPVRVVAFLELFQMVTFPLAGLVFFNEALGGSVLLGGLLIGMASVIALA